MRAIRAAVLGLGVTWLVAPPLWAGHTLTAAQQEVLHQWLGGHANLRLATAEDCDCADDISNMRRGYGGKWKGVPDYHPYIARGDFNSDGAEDFAVVLVDRSVSEKKFTFVVFNGPMKPGAKDPAFMQTGLELAHRGLFFGPPRPKPHHLVLGAFESEGGILKPKGRTYTWVYEEP